LRWDSFTSVTAVRLLLSPASLVRLRGPGGVQRGTPGGCGCGVWGSGRGCSARRAWIGCFLGELAGCYVQNLNQDSRNSCTFASDSGHAGAEGGEAGRGGYSQLRLGEEDFLERLDGPGLQLVLGLIAVGRLARLAAGAAVDLGALGAAGALEALAPQAGEQPLAAVEVGRLRRPAAGLEDLVHLGAVNLVAAARASARARAWMWQQQRACAWMRRLKRKILETGL
jgi:hypothetical protein